MPLSDNVVAGYKLNGPNALNVWPDWMNNANFALSPINAPAAVPGVDGQALYAQIETPPSTNKYLQTDPANIALNVTNTGFTCSFDFYPILPAILRPGPFDLNGGQILGKAKQTWGNTQANGSNWTVTYAYSASAGAWLIYFNVFFGTGQSVPASVIFAPNVVNIGSYFNTWYRVVCWSDGVSACHISINCTQGDGAIQGALITANNPFVVGAALYTNTDSGPNTSANGYIDNLYLWSRQLNNTELGLVCTGTNPAPPASAFVGELAAVVDDPTLA